MINSKNYLATLTFLFDGLKCIIWSKFILFTCILSKTFFSFKYSPMLEWLPNISNVRSKIVTENAVFSLVVPEAFETQDSVFNRFNMNSKILIPFDTPRRVTQKLSPGWSLASNLQITTRMYRRKTYQPNWTFYLSLSSWHIEGSCWHGKMIFSLQNQPFSWFIRTNTYIFECESSPLLFPLLYASERLLE